MLFQTSKHLSLSSEKKLRYFWWNPRAFWPCIDSNATTMFKAQKVIEDIIKTVHVTSVVQPYFYEATIILFVHKENNNKDFIQRFLLIRVSLFHKFTRNTTYVHHDLRLAFEAQAPLGFTDMW